ncbi:MAG: tRNA 2-thiouridine(34) synthase MnmA [Candidatus Omnitrophica bacterium]|nr:tRNA 2-thiouridine(34) synthase MnmA [Candidatus Omnitrophota bacterium]
MKKKQVTVAMSGGVDSSLCAYILKKKGYDTRGLTMSLYPGSGHVQRAEKVADILRIPHRVIDISGQFENKVINNFCCEYITGRTPNPCLLCNRFIKFGLLMSKFLPRGGYFATGHYAKVIYEKKNNMYKLQRGGDIKKEQSYVLYMLNQKQLARILLPLGNMTKDQIRKKAKQLKLPIDESDESQDICFIKNQSYIDFIRSKVKGFKPEPGNIVRLNGQVMGKHKGRIFYTVGQRKGLGIAYKVPLFVFGFNEKENTVIVAEENELYARAFEIKDVFFTHPGYKKSSFNAAVKIRYHHTASRALVTALPNGRFRVKFMQAQKAITPGQGAVFYKRNTVLGGGIITKVCK